MSQPAFLERVDGQEVVADPRGQWMHDFRNALGNIVIAAGAARERSSGTTDARLSALLAQIDEGRGRCMALLEAMPR